MDTQFFFRKREVRQQKSYEKNDKVLQISVLYNMDIGIRQTGLNPSLYPPPAQKTTDCWAAARLNQGPLHLLLSFMSEQQPKHMEWAMAKKSPFIRQMYQKTEWHGVGIGNS